MNVNSLLKKYFSSTNKHLEAELTRETLKDMFQNNQKRLSHILGVVREAELLSEYFSDVKEQLIQTALLHDTGYAEDLIVTSFHPVDSALYASNWKYTENVLKAVLLHTGAEGEGKQISKEIENFYHELNALISEEDQRLIDLITYCDIHTSPTGTPLSIEYRIHDIMSRYNSDHPVHKNIKGHFNTFDSVRKNVLKELNKKINTLPWIFLDVDNTLITPGGSVGYRTKQAILSYIEAGGKISLVTGKIPVSIAETITELGLEQFPHIGGNGAIIQFEQELELVNQLGSSSSEIMRIIDMLGIPYCMYETDQIFYSSENINESHINYLLSINEPLPQKSTNLIGENAIKLLMFVDVEDAETRKQVEKELQPWENAVSLIQTSPKLLEIMHINQNKGNAIKKIAEKHQKFYRYSIAVGDSENDITMLNTVGKPFIVKNASLQLKEMNFEVIPSCHQEGVAQLIEKTLEEGGIPIELQW